MGCDFDSYPYRVTTYARQMIIRGSNITERSLVTRCRLQSTVRSDNNPQGFLAEHFEILENRDLRTMGTKSTVKEKAKAYLESLSEKQKRGILIAMLVFTCIASGIVLLRAAGRLKPARERMELPFGEGSLSDTLRRLPDPLRGQETNIYRTIKQPQQNGKQEE